MSQRERLLGRRVPPTPVSIRVDFSPEADAAFAAYGEAVRDLQLAESRTADLNAARERVTAAKAALEPYQEVLLVSSIAARDYDDLIGAHQPTDEQRAKNYQWNPDGFVPALLAACIGQDVPAAERMTEDDWAAWMRTPSAAASGELALLFNTCLRVNDRSLDLNVGKG